MQKHHMLLLRCAPCRQAQPSGKLQHICAYVRVCCDDIRIGNFFVLQENHPNLYTTLHFFVSTRATDYVSFNLITCVVFIYNVLTGLVTSLITMSLTNYPQIKDFLIQLLYVVCLSYDQWHLFFYFPRLVKLDDPSSFYFASPKHVSLKQVHGKKAVVVVELPSEEDVRLRRRHP